MWYSDRYFSRFSCHSRKSQDSTASFHILFQTYIPPSLPPSLSKIELPNRPPSYHYHKCCFRRSPPHDLAESSQLLISLLYRQQPSAQFLSVRNEGTLMVPPAPPSGSLYPLFNIGTNWLNFTKLCVNAKLLQVTPPSLSIIAVTLCEC
jgi:hypothetical protein